MAITTLGGPNWPDDWDAKEHTMAIPLEAACPEQDDPPKAGDDAVDALDHWIQRAETAEAQLASARKALEEIDKIISDFERTMTLPKAKELKQIWNIARAALKPEPTK